MSYMDSSGNPDKSIVPWTEVHNAVRSYIATLIKALAPSTTFAEEIGIEGRRADILVFALPTHLLGPMAFLAGKEINVIIDVKTALSKDKVWNRGAQVLEYIVDIIKTYIKMVLDRPSKEGLRSFSWPEFKGMVIRIGGFDENLGYTGSPGIVLLTPGRSCTLSKYMMILSPKGSIETDRENIELLKELITRLKEEGNDKLASKLVKNFSNAIHKVVTYLFPAAGVDKERIGNIKSLAADLVDMAFIEGMFKRESPGSVSTLLEFIPRPKVETLRKLLKERALLITSIDEARKLLDLGITKEDLIEAIGSGAVLPEVIPELVVEEIISKEDLMRLIKSYGLSSEIILSLIESGVLQKADIISMIKQGILSPTMVADLVSQEVISVEDLKSLGLRAVSYLYELYSRGLITEEELRDTLNNLRVFIVSLSGNEE